MELAFVCVDRRFLDESPDGVMYGVMCFLVRFVEALGAAALLTSSFAIIANTFPDRVATMFVRYCFAYHAFHRRN